MQVIDLSPHCDESADIRGGRQRLSLCDDPGYSCRDCQCPQHAKADNFSIELRQVLHCHQVTHRKELHFKPPKRLQVQSRLTKARCVRREQRYFTGAGRQAQKTHSRDELNSRSGNDRARSQVAPSSAFCQFLFDLPYFVTAKTVEKDRKRTQHGEYAREDTEHQPDTDHCTFTLILVGHEPE